MTHDRNACFHLTLISHRHERKHLPNPVSYEEICFRMTNIFPVHFFKDIRNLSTSQPACCRFSQNSRSSGFWCQSWLVCRHSYLLITSATLTTRDIISPRTFLIFMGQIIPKARRRIFFLLSSLRQLFFSFLNKHRILIQFLHPKHPTAMGFIRRENLWSPTPIRIIDHLRKILIFGVNNNTSSRGRGFRYLTLPRFQFFLPSYKLLLCFKCLQRCCLSSTANRWSLSIGN